MTRYVLLPRHGLRWRPGERGPAVAQEVASGVEDELPGPEPGAVLVSLPARRARELRAGAEDLQVAPMRLYRLALHRPEIAAAPPAADGG